MAIEKPGEVITFYSYTGGVGRSMALANVACLLARRCPEDRGVLMVDWSLQSPSLHRFFHNCPAKLDDRPGLLELFKELDFCVPQSGSTTKSLREAITTVDPGRFAIPTSIPALSLLKAGRLDSDYFSAVSTFPWAGLHERAPQLMESLVKFWSRHYRFVLIDSPSGVNDMSGLCAMMLPDKLVAAFTLSRQSLLGTLEAVRCSADYRKDADRPLPLAIYPVPCKVDVAEPELRNDWRFGGASVNGEGYQARFEALFRELEPGIECKLDTYFADVQIPYAPHYSYGDQIAATSGECPLTEAYRNLADRLSQTAHPREAFSAETNLAIIEIDGRAVPLTEALEPCLRDVERHMASGDAAHVTESLELAATIKERQGKLEEAEAHCLDAVAFCRTKQYHIGLASAVSRLARLQRVMGRFEHARMYYLDAAGLYRNERMNAALASTLAILGDLDAHVGETQAAREHCQEAIERFRDEWDDTAVARTLMRLGGIEKQIGSDDAALERYREAVRLYQRQRDNTGLASALSNLAEVQVRTGAIEQAEENYSRAAQLCRGERDSLRLAYALRSLADVRLRLKRLEEATALYQESLALFRGEQENLGLAIALQSLADVETRSGKYPDAQLHYAESIVLYRTESNNLGVANSMRSLGDLERRLGRFEAARSNYEQAMELYRAEGNSLGLANSLQSLGDLAKRLGKRDDAEQRYQQAIQIYRTANANLGLANSLKSLGDVEFEAGNARVARDHFEQAIELYRSAGKTLGLANALQSLGDLDRNEKSYKEAISHYTTACDLYRKEKHMVGLAYTCSELARVSHALFDFAASIDYLDQASRAAKDSNAPSVIAYVLDVHREIQGSTVNVGA